MFQSDSCALCLVGATRAPGKACHSMSWVLTETTMQRMRGCRIRWSHNAACDLWVLATVVPLHWSYKKMASKKFLKWIYFKEIPKFHTTHARCLIAFHLTCHFRKEFVNYGHWTWSQWTKNTPVLHSESQGSEWLDARWPNKMMVPS